MIYALGNSHANYFANSHPGVLGFGDPSQFNYGKERNEHFMSYSANFHNPNPKYRHVLAHKFMERYYPYITNVINNINYTENDYIMLIVGEIDCRWHIPKKITLQNLPAEEVVLEFINDLFPAFINLQENGYNVVGWGGQPSTTGNHNDDPDNPVYGDCLFRNKISLLWNDLLYNKCKEHGMKFVSIIRDLIDESGLTKMEYFMDYCHLTQKSFPMVLEKCKLEGIIR
jgi:hypothetical protein